MAGTKVSFDIPSDFEQTWEDFLERKPLNTPLARHIREAVKGYMEKGEHAMLLIQDREGRIVNLAQARFILESNHPNIPGCFVVFGDLSVTQLSILYKMAGYPEKGKIAGKDVSGMNIKELESYLEEQELVDLFPNGKVFQLDMSAAALQGYIETKIGERILDTREATSVGNAQLQQKSGG